MMIVNNLLLKIKEPEQVAQVEKALLSMKGNIEQLLDIRVERNLRDSGYDLMMIASYKSMDKLEAYLIHPVHLDVVKIIGPMIAAQASACYQE